MLCPRPEPANCFGGFLTYELKPRAEERSRTRISTVALVTCSDTGRFNECHPGSSNHATSSFSVPSLLQRCSSQWNFGAELKTLGAYLSFLDLAAARSSFARHSAAFSFWPQAS